MYIAGNAITENYDVAILWVVCILYFLDIRQVFYKPLLCHLAVIHTIIIIV